MLDILNTLFGGQKPARQQGLTMADAMQGWGQQPQQPDPAGDVPLTGHPSTWSGQIQTALGAKPADTGGMAQDILAGRFQSPAPSWDDIYKSGQDSLNGKATTAQDYADEGLKNSMGLLGEIAKMQYLTSGGGRGGAGGGSVFAQTMAAINADPVLAGLPQIEKIRLAQKGMGQNLTYDAQGNVVDMTGAAAGLSNLAYGEKRGGTQGTKDVELTMNPAIERGVSDQRNISDINAAAPKATQTAVGTAQGDAVTKLADLQAQYPQTQDLYNNLSKIAKSATYTVAGQGYGALLRQAGLKVPEGIVDREAYINTANDQVLPLLRRTFGAQFTEREGERLMATLGNPNKSPPEKQAALDAFMQTQTDILQTAKRRVGGGDAGVGSTAPAQNNTVIKFDAQGNPI